MDENPYEPPQVPSEPEKRKPPAAFVAIFAPFALPAAIIAFLTMCGAHGAMNFSQGVALVAVTCLFAVSGTVFLVSMWYLVDRWFRDVD